MHLELPHATESFTAALASIENRITVGTLTPEAAVPELCSAIRASCLACARVPSEDGDTDDLKKSFRESIAPWFSRSWFMDRALQKPCGHPGDYQMLEAIYDRQAQSEGIGRALDLYFLQTALAAAVTGRKNWIRDFLKAFLPSCGSSPRILDIACGSCREIRELAGTGYEPFQLSALDFDQGALDFSKAMLERTPVLVGELTTVKQNVLRMTSATRNIKQFGLFDLIYSVGLYDYLPDKILVRLLSATAQMLVPGGRYILAFKDADRYDCTEYQWHVDWYFFQRTETECRTLIERAGLEIVSMEREPSGVIMMFTAKNKD